MIDRLRKEIQDRLDQLATEADKLRKALAALDPRGRTSSTERKAPARKATARKPARAASTAAKSSAAKPASARQTRNGAPSSPRRTARGETKAAVLAALAGGEAMTAGQVAKEAGLARGTVSTTLTNLAKAGAVEKAERGYRLAPSGQAAPAASSE